MKKELQAVILGAGKGSRLADLTNFIPKCLLPVGNKPLIHFPLTMLIEAGFKDVIVIVSDIFENEIKSKLLNKYEIHIEYFSIPSNNDLDTADSLRLLNKKLLCDVLLITCDIVSNFPLKNFINFYRIYDPTICVLIANKSSVSTQGNLPGRKEKFKIDRDIIGIDAKNRDRLVFFKSEVDFEDYISFNVSNIKICSNTDLSTKYLDTHVYILKKYVLEFLFEKQNISSVKNELLPYIIKAQFKKLPASKNCNRFDYNTNSLKIDKLDEIKDIFYYLDIDEITEKINSFNPLNFGKFKFSVKNLKYPQNIIKCSPYMINNENNQYFVARSNYLIAYYEINMLSKNLISSSLKADMLKTNNFYKCIIGDNTKVHEKTSIKNSVIGSNCQIDEKIILENCLIMDNVKINELCVLKNSIICCNSVIGKKCEIDNCIIGFGQNILDSSKLFSETIVNTDQLIEI